MKIINMWQDELSKIMKDNLIVDKHKYHPFSILPLISYQKWK